MAPSVSGTKMRKNEEKKSKHIFAYISSRMHFAVRGKSVWDVCDKLTLHSIRVTDEDESSLTPTPRTRYTRVNRTNIKKRMRDVSSDNKISLMKWEMS